MSSYKSGQTSSHNDALDQQQRFQIHFIGAVKPGIART